MHGKKGLQRHPVPASIVIAVVTWLCASCGGAPQYDDTANMQLTNLQKEVDSQIVRFISDDRQHDPASLKDANYSQNIKWYNNVDTDSTALELRMEAIVDPSTANLPEIFNNLHAQMMNIENLHRKEGNLPAVVWIPLRNQLNAQFAVLLTYELSLKNVNSTSSSPSTKSTATAAANAKVSTAPISK